MTSEKTDVDTQAGWLDLAGRRRPADLDRLLETLSECSIPELTERIELLAEFPPEPRLAVRALELSHAFSSFPAAKLSRSALALVSRMGDATLLPRMNELLATARVFQPSQQRFADLRKLAERARD